MEQVKTILETIVFAVDLVGIAILVFAALKFIEHYLGLEIKRLQGLECVKGIDLVTAYPALPKPTRL